MRPIRIILPMLLMMSTAMMAQNSYEYWIDGDYANHKTASGTTVNISVPTKALSSGLHAFCYRVVDGSSWTNLYHSLFFIPERLVEASTNAQYEYWIDGDYANHQTASGSNATITLPTNGLTPGLHAFSYRVVKADGSWTNLYRSLFFIPERLVETSANAQYEYWIDGDYANHQTVTGSNATITLPTNGLTPGLHAFTYRVVKADCSWTNLYRSLFFIPERLVEASANAQYEYWIDGDYANHQTVSGSNATITLPTNDLAPGLHAFSYRVVKPDGSWTNLYRSLFFIPNQKVGQNPEIAAYEYWIDDNWENRQTALDAKNLSQLTTSIKGLSEGEHQFVIRVKNTAGTWSGLYYIPFEIVYKPGDANGDDVVDVADVVAIVNYILGDIAENFKIHAANVDGEVNEDGNPNISVSDVVGVVNIILEQPATGKQETE